MRRGYRISSITSLMVIMLLLGSIVCSTINALGSVHHAQSVAAIKKPRSSSASETQLSEQIESENDHKLNITLFFIYPVGEILRFDSTLSQHLCFFKATRFRGNTTGLPLYLTVRSIMI